MVSTYKTSVDLYREAKKKKKKGTRHILSGHNELVNWPARCSVSRFFQWKLNSIGKLEWHYTAQKPCSLRKETLGTYASRPGRQWMWSTGSSRGTRAAAPAPTACGRGSAPARTCVLLSPPANNKHCSYHKLIVFFN